MPGPRNACSCSICARRGKYDEARALYRILTPAFHLDTDVKLVQYIKLAEQVVYGAPEWVREPRLPLIGAERARVLGVIEATVTALQAKSAQRSAA